MEIEVKRELNGRSISIKTEIHAERLESAIIEINKAIEAFEANRKPGDMPRQ